MESSQHNRGNISSLIGGKMLNFGIEAFLILIFLNITTKLVIFVTSSLRYSLVIKDFKIRGRQRN